MLIRDVIRRKSRWVKIAWISLVERATLERAAAVHVTAQLEGEELRALRLPAKRVVEIPNGVDSPGVRVAAAETAFANLPGRYALFLSRISWKKGLDRLITAWRQVSGLALVIAGNDEENYRPRLAALAASAGVADRVLFLGPVSDQCKWKLYEDAEMFILPSYSENFGNVVAEAMLKGCPVVITPEVGIAPLVREARAGIVVSNDPSELAAAIRSLHADESRRRELGANARRAVLDKLSWTAVAAQMESLYAEISE